MNRKTNQFKEFKRYSKSFNYTSLVHLLQFIWSWPIRQIPQCSPFLYHQQVYN